jgi:L-ascorbate metabolism protein UlaG (beta-lactamase superfamily)
VTTQHAKHALTNKLPEEDRFTAVTSLNTWDSVYISNTDSGSDAAKVIRITATPAKHVDEGSGAADAIPSQLKELSAAVAIPVNGYLLELGHSRRDSELDVEYTIYISGDTVMVDELKEIPERFPKIDLMLVHLGGAKLPSPSPPNLLISMDAEQGVQLMNLIRPDVTIPIHFDDYGAHILDVVGVAFG